MCVAAGDVLFCFADPCLQSCCVWLQVAREIRLHSTLDNEAIIGMFAAWKDRHYVYIALEWAHGVRWVRSVVYQGVT